MEPDFDSSALCEGIFSAVSPTYINCRMNQAVGESLFDDPMQDRFLLQRNENETAHLKKRSLSSMMACCDVQDSETVAYRRSRSSMHIGNGPNTSLREFPRMATPLEQSNKHPNQQEIFHDVEDFNLHFPQRDDVEKLVLNPLDNKNKLMRISVSPNMMRGLLTTSTSLESQCKTPATSTLRNALCTTTETVAINSTQATTASKQNELVSSTIENSSCEKNCDTHPQIYRRNRSILITSVIVLVVIGFVATFSVPIQRQEYAPSKKQHSRIMQPSPWSWQPWDLYWADLVAAKDTIPKTAVLTKTKSHPSPPTLRDVLLDHDTGFHLAMAPAFFGFYAYFGVLDAWMEAVQHTTGSRHLPLRSVVGASAGAMTAILLGAGIDPQVAANFCANITLGKFADFPGFGAVFRGNKFEAIMDNFVRLQSVDRSAMNSTLVSFTGNLQDALLPIAVTAFDLQTMKGHIVQTGSMARAARASATFPGLFQPVAWEDDDNNDYVFIDGGITDPAGILGLQATMKSTEIGKVKLERVINLSVGGFRSNSPPGPAILPGNPEVISVSIMGTPLPGPWAMQNGPKAFAAARLAMTEALDLPLQQVVPNRRKSSDKTIDSSQSHFEILVNASKIK